jgi:sugar transferase (PEP-CTERM system associated)
LVLATGLMVTRLVFERYVDGQLLRRNILVLGIGKRARRIEQLRRKSDRRGFNLVGFLPSKGCQHCYISSEKLIKLNSICDYALSNQVDEIVIALDDRRQGLPITDLLDCRMSGIEVTEDLDFFEREASVVQLDLIQSGWLIRSKGFTNNSLSHFLKRTLDVVVSAVLSLCFLPVLLLTAIAIKIECGWSAPIFYTQRRVGRGGSEFTIYKLRSMSQNAEADGVAQWAKADDSRVTRVGTFIRKYRIDEIPQIWNVLLGDMSLVGPRPERKEFVGSLSELSEYYSHRHRVAPGLTGWAQLCYPYGASDKDAMEKLKYDLYYIKNHGLFLDIYILMQTVEVVLFKKGAR